MTPAGAQSLAGVVCPHCASPVSGYTSFVTRASRELLEDALTLSEQDRLELASELIASVDGPPDADWEAAWTAEIERRIAAADAGGAPSSDWSDARARILAKLGKK